MEKRRIRVRDEDHLRALIAKCIASDGPECDLNHLDVSRVTSMYNLFESEYEFNGNVSKWDTSNVEWMDGLFQETAFRGDISKWNVAKVRSMAYMFSQCPFNGDLSSWTIAPSSICTDVEGMLSSSGATDRVGLQLPTRMLDFPVQTMFSNAPGAMHAWLASTPVCRYHWDALLEETSGTSIPWATPEMHQHMARMLPSFQSLGLPPLDVAQSLATSWTHRARPQGPNELPLPQLDEQ